MIKPALCPNNRGRYNSAKTVVGRFWLLAQRGWSLVRPVAFLLVLLVTVRRAPAQCPTGTIPNFTGFFTVDGFNLAWDPPSGADAGTAYDIFEATFPDYCAFVAAGPPSYGLVASVTGTSYTTGLYSSNVVYAFFVRVQGCDNVYTTYSVYVDTFGAPQKPTLISALASAPNEVTLIYSYPNAEVDVFYIFRRAASDVNFAQVGSLGLSSQSFCPPGTHTFVDGTVSEGFYVYEVEVWNQSYGFGVASDPIGIVVGPSCTAPMARPMVSVPPGPVLVGSPVNVNWMDSETVDDFLIETASDPGFGKVQNSFTVPGTARTTTVSFASPGTYFVRVSAERVCGSIVGTSVSVVAVAACVAPKVPPVISGPTVPLPVASPVNLNWTDSEVVDSFLVETSTNSSFAPDLNSFTVPGSQHGASLVFDVAGNYFVRVTAENSCGSGPSSNTVAIAAAPAPPLIAVTPAQVALLEAADSAGGAAAYSVRNTGGTSTTITASQVGGFFSQSPTTFSLGPGQSQVVQVSALAESPGSYSGSIGFSGNGVPEGLLVGVSLLSVQPSNGAAAGQPTMPQVDVVAPAGTTNPTGNVSFVNSGDGPLAGILTADVPWIIPQAEPVSIAPGGTASASFVIDRSKRPDGASPLGTQSGTLSLTYLTATTLSGPSDFVSPLQAQRQGSGSGSVSKVSVNDTVIPPITSSVPPPLSPGELALFLPGVGHVVGGVGLFESDVTVANTLGASALSDVAFFYTPVTGASSTSSVSSAGHFSIFRARRNSSRQLLRLPVNTGSVQKASIPTLSVGTSADFTDLVKNVFDLASSVGSLQIRSKDSDKIEANATILNVSGSVGTYGTSIPVFRSDRGIGAGQSLFLTGLRKDTGFRTNFYVQEVSGNDAAVHTDFLDVNGGALKSRDDSISPFGLLQILDPLPAGAVAARMTVGQASAGKVLAYATPVDATSGDSWDVPDWSRQFGYDPSQPVVVPAAGTAPGANGTNFHTDLAITNTGDAQGSGALTYYDGVGRTFTQSVLLAAGQTLVSNDVVADLFGVTPPSIGYLVFTPAASTFAVTSRTYNAVPGSTATYGTSAPTVALSSGLTVGQSRRICGLLDSSDQRIGARTGHTFRTNIGLLELSGASVTVRLTLLEADGTVLGSRDFPLAANGFELVSNLGDAILGSSRPQTDLKDIQVFVEVIGGSGSAIAFFSSVDNGSGDSTLRTE
jgi:hypothetical protein